jgi:hypothetical protein
MNSQPSPNPSISQRDAVVSRSRLPRWIRRAAFESLLIVFSLVLAFVVNEWREGRALDRRVQEARALVAEELRFNRDSIASAEFLVHHRQLRDRYRALSNAEQPAGEPIFDSGVHIATLRDAAWRTLASPEIIAHVPYGEIVVLADLYQEQERLEKMHWTMVPWLLAPRAPDPQAAQLRAFNRSVALYLADVVSSEERLHRSYDAALRMLAPKPGT